MSSLYQNSAIGFLAEVRPAPSGMYEGSLSLNRQSPSRPESPVYYALGPMDQFEVWGGKRLMERDRRTDLAFYNFIKELA